MRLRRLRRGTAPVLSPPWHPNPLQSDAALDAAAAAGAAMPLSPLQASSGACVSGVLPPPQVGAAATTVYVPGGWFSSPPMPQGTWRPNPLQSGDAVGAASAAVVALAAAATPVRVGAPEPAGAGALPSGADCDGASEVGGAWAGTVAASAGIGWCAEGGGWPQPPPVSSSSSAAAGYDAFGGVVGGARAAASGPMLGRAAPLAVSGRPATAARAGDAWVHNPAAGHPSAGATAAGAGWQSRDAAQVPVAAQSWGGGDWTPRDAARGAAGDTAADGAGGGVDAWVSTPACGVPVASPALASLVQPPQRGGDWVPNPAAGVPIAVAAVQPFVQREAAPGSPDASAPHGGGGEWLPNPVTASYEMQWEAPAAAPAPGTGVMGPGTGVVGRSNPAYDTAPRSLPPPLPLPMARGGGGGMSLAALSSAMGWNGSPIGAAAESPSPSPSQQGRSERAPPPYPPPPGSLPARPSSSADTRGGWLANPVPAATAAAAAVGAGVAGVDVRGSRAGSDSAASSRDDAGAGMTVLDVGTAAPAPAVTPSAAGAVDDWGTPVPPPPLVSRRGSAPVLNSGGGALVLQLGGGGGGAPAAAALPDDRAAAIARAAPPPPLPMMTPELYAAAQRRGAAPRYAALPVLPMPDATGRRGSVDVTGAQL